MDDNNVNNFYRDNNVDGTKDMFNSFDGTIPNFGIPGPKDDEPNNFDPEPPFDKSLALEDNSWTEIVPGEKKQSIAVTVDGREVVVDEATPPRTIYHDDVSAVQVVNTPPPFKVYDKPLDDAVNDFAPDNSQSNSNELPEDKEYLEKLQEIMDVYDRYQELLKYFGKTDISEVLRDAQNNQNINELPKEEPVDNFDGGIKL